MLVGIVYSYACTFDDKLIGGALYVITFVDDHLSRNVWVISMRTKYYAFDIFKTFYVKVETETCKLLKSLYSHNEGEIISNMFNE